MPKYSVIIPVYNRPNEVDELLTSLQGQTFKDFEVLIVEDGSSNKCESVVEKYKESLNVNYYFKENSGQGFSRNFGFERSSGEWLIVFDSDCLIPIDYFEQVEKHLRINSSLDAFGGPDRSHESFTPVQKSISYAMTSFITTGGIRGNKKHLGSFHPRSFNMGIRKKVFEKTNGYLLPRKGEDIEFSIRIINNGFNTALIEEAFVYHKRRTNFKQFFKQLHFFGTARINVYRFFKSELKLVHFFPSVFLMGLLFSLGIVPIYPKIGVMGLSIYAIYFVLILVDSSFRTKSLKVGILSVFASLIQLTAYGLGLIQEGILFLRKG
jgi:glycosyltransferase involved in cell wall biosynthesis